MSEKERIYWAEYEFETRGALRDRTEPYFTELPGRYISREEAFTAFENRCEESLKRRAPPDFTEFHLTRILSEEEYRKRLFDLTGQKHNSLRCGE